MEPLTTQRRLLGLALSTLAFLSCVFACSIAQAAGKFALLIGSGAYASEIGALTNPTKDIALIGEKLSMLGFKVVQVSNATLADLHRAINKHASVVKAAGPGAVSFFYYSGHGASLDSDQNYLIPVDAPSADADSLLQNSIDLKADVIDKLATRAPEAIHYVIFDACRNELQLRINGKKSFSIDGKSFVPISQTNSVLVAYATAAKRTASDSGVTSGPYARILSEELATPGTEAVTMFRAVQLRVMNSIGQSPFLSVPAIPAFYFAGTAAGPASNPNLSQSLDRVPAPQLQQAAFNVERASSKQTMRSLLKQMGAAGLQPGGIVDAAKVWPKGSTLTACFSDGSDIEMRYVASVAIQWSLYGNVVFDFGDRESPNKCVASVPIEWNVRITFKQFGNWAMLGTDSKSVPQSEPTVSLQSVAAASMADVSKGRFDGEILHEFGHVLGFTHSWLIPACEGELDWPAIYRDLARNFGWSRQTIDLNLRSGDGKALRNVGTFDRTSVMSYKLPASFFRNGPESSCYMEPIGQLSLKDKLAVFQVYPE